MEHSLITRTRQLPGNHAMRCNKRESLVACRCYAMYADRNFPFLGKLPL